MKLKSITQSASDIFVASVMSKYDSEHYDKAKYANNGQISFREDIHEYRNVNKNIVYKSVTTFIGEYQKKFNPEYWSLYKAIEDIVIHQYNKQLWYSIKTKLKSYKDNEDDGILFMKDFIKRNQLTNAYSKAELLIEQWANKSKKACEKGTAYHNMKEDEAYSNGYDSISNMLRVPTALSYSFDLTKLEDGFHAELLLYNDYFQISGKADKIIIKTQPDGRRFVYIDDYKTNEKIPKTNTFQTFKKPISHLDDCKWNVYRLQLSLYGVLLELAGYEVVHTQLTHVTDFGEFYERFDMLRSDVYKLLDDRATQLYNKNGNTK